MQITLSGDLRRVRAEIQILDLAVQIIEDAVWHERSGLLRPENYLLNAEDPAQLEDRSFFPEVSFAKDPVGYDAQWHPVGYVQDSEPTPEDAVFSMGMLLYQMQTGKMIDTGMAEFTLMSITPGDENSYLPEEVAQSLSTLPDPERLPVVWSLIAQMTELNPKRRIRMVDALKLITERVPSSVTVEIIDRDTLDVLDSVEVACSRHMTEYPVAREYRFRNRSFVPVVLRDAFLIPYRCVKRTIPLYVKAPELRQKPVSIAQKLCIGIDFGTWNTSVSYISDTGIAEELLWDNARYLRSVIAFRSANEPVFGREAAELAMQYPTAAAECFKRNMDIREPLRLRSAAGEPIELDGVRAVRLFMQFLLDACRTRLNASPENSSVVLTVPACYDEGVRTAMQEAAASTGFTVQILTEPEAAAFYFGTTMDKPCAGNVLVIDIGGGTADISLLECTPSDDPAELAEMRTLAKRGKAKLGGTDFTGIIYQDMLTHLREEHGLDMFSEPASGLTPLQFSANERALRNAAEQIKLRLSQSDRAEATVSLAMSGTAERADITLTEKRAAYQVRLRAEYLRPLRSTIRALISGDGGVQLTQLDQVILTGGASATPAVQSFIREMFEDTGIRVDCISCPTAVSRGAAIYANALSGSTARRQQALDSVIYDIGTVTVGAFDARPRFTPLIEAGTRFFDGMSIHAGTQPARLTQKEIAGGYVKLFLYVRPPEMRHVQFTTDPEGNAIRPIGSFRIAPLPDYFDPNTGLISFQLELTPQECIYAQAAFYVPDAKTGEMMLLDMPIPLTLDVTDRGAAK